MNGAFLKAVLIDEISLILAPLAVGGKETPSLLNCENLGSLNEVTSLELMKTKPVGDKGAVWLHYRVKGSS
ncbi:hypothetical protein LD39_04500 [Halobacillus sp. BBL2006]|nr:hypothetical protein LD39_04500 [Halobacillus sp. BBL2006]